MATAFGTAATVSGALTAAQGTVAVDTANYPAGAVGISLTGTFSATVTFEATTDGANFFSVAAYSSAGGAASQTATATGQFIIPVYGYAAIRVRCSAYTSGTVSVSMDTCPAGFASGGPLPNGGRITDSFTAGGSASAPSAAAVLATVTPGIAGQYRINVTCGTFGGSPTGAADVQNIGLYKTSTLLLTCSYVPAGCNVQPPVLATLTAANTVNLKAIGNATASVYYYGTLTAELIA